MSGKRYTNEFKEEAIKQVIERGYTVREVAQRLDVSAHSLYEWVRAARGSSNGKKADELEVMRTENARLKYRFIHDHRNKFSIVSMCRVLRVNRAGFYAWLG